MTATFEIKGLKALEAELAKLKNPTARGVGQRAMRKALKPIEETANSFWPGSRDNAFRTTSRVSRSQPQPKASPTLLNMFVGSPEPHAHLLEFGTGPRTQTTTGRFTGSVSPLPMLQPAWDIHRDDIPNELRTVLGEEIKKTFARIAAKASRGA